MENSSQNGDYSDQSSCNVSIEMWMDIGTSEKQVDVNFYIASNNKVPSKNYFDRPDGASIAICIHFNSHFWSPKNPCLSLASRSIQIPNLLTYCTEVEYV